MLSETIYEWQPQIDRVRAEWFEHRQDCKAIRGMLVPPWETIEEPKSLRIRYGCDTCDGYAEHLMELINRSPFKIIMTKEEQVK